VIEHGFVSLSTIVGRMKIQFNYYDELNKFREWKTIGITLVYKDAIRDFYLGVSVENLNPIEKMDGPVLGIDRGLRNLVVTSDSRFFNSKRMNNTRGRYAYNRKTLQAKGTSSAKRRLKKMSGRERRFIACENHKLTKEIVNGKHAYFALENLKGIGNHRILQGDMPTRLNQWPQGQFADFLKYKAEEMGKTAILVSPFLTSRKCSVCGHEDSKNRKGSEFKCVSCGFKLIADSNAARNIANAGKTCVSRLPVNQPNAPCYEGRTLKWDSGVTEHRCKY
jgi:IS605 OrfB family transposase